MESRGGKCLVFFMNELFIVFANEIFPFLWNHGFSYLRLCISLSFSIFMFCVYYDPKQCDNNLVFIFLIISLYSNDKQKLNKR